ncbi:MAG: peptidoglycan DD-metalloendopeptidase family protein [Candidatus Magasanikbacteria bacterium]|nr:peptidoglycan DD-metalloendopeptidase family protein [Candidatus Magasanikbacteria bacterium]
MSRYYYRVILLLLRLVMYAKRALVWCGRQMLRAGVILATFYQNFLGFRFYKFFFGFRKYVAGISISVTGWMVDTIGRRGVLEVILLAVALVVMIPHSRWYRQDTPIFPGRDTVLYRLVGPSEESDNNIEEISFVAPSPGESAAPNWRAGAVVSGPNAGQPNAALPQEIAGVNVGRAALSKPTIIGSSSAAPTRSAEPSAERNSVIEYVVQAGDVVGAIAGRYRVSVATILSANNLTERSYIRPGDKLRIPPVSGVLHTVKKGDSLGKLAKLYKAKEDDIIRANKLQPDGRDIVIGEELIIPGGEKPVPVAAPAKRYAVLRSLTAPPPSIEAPAGSGYIWPTTVRRITQYFGLRHTGIDIAGPIGTPLFAARGGVVTRANCEWNGGYGCNIILDHGDGVNTLYGHASELLVGVGEEVSQGQTIALMGSTGHSTGPHIHFEVRVNRKWQNPLRYVR